MAYAPNDSTAAAPARAPIFRIRGDIATSEVVAASKRARAPCDRPKKRRFLSPITFCGRRLEIAPNALWTRALWGRRPPATTPPLIRSLRLLSDDRLARMAGDGNDAAFAALHRRYDAILHGYTRSIARDADDSADALQNTWIAALIALRAGRRSAPVRPWLFRIAHNSAVDVLRRRSAAVRPTDRGFLAVAPSA